MIRKPADKKDAKDQKKKQDSNKKKVTSILNDEDDVGEVKFLK